MIEFPEKRLVVFEVTFKGLIIVNLSPLSPLSPSKVNGLFITTCSLYVPAATMIVAQALSLTAAREF